MVLINKFGLLQFQVCREWKEIAIVTRSKVFKESEQSEIDLFDVKVCLDFLYSIITFIWDYKFSSDNTVHVSAHLEYE